MNRPAHRLLPGSSTNTASLRIAAAQFPVSGDVQQNLAHVKKLIAQASSEGADVVHFPETALSGYAPRHSTGPESKELLAEATAEVRRLAASSGLWVVLGTAHPRGASLPRNSTLVISRDGSLAGVYDKRRLYGRENDFYEAGTDPLVVDIDGVRCGFLICYENCFPSLYTEYRRLGVTVLFHSFFNAANSRPTSIRHLMPATLLVRAADNGTHISAANSSESYSPLPAGIVRPDGVSSWVDRHVTGLVIEEVPASGLEWTYAPEDISVSGSTHT